jgi:general secretion pathway protein K
MSAAPRRGQGGPRTPAQGGTRRGGTRRRGAAVLLALVVSMLATIIVAELFWRQFVILRTVENRQVDAQMHLLLRGALDWARAILRDQSHPAYDALSDPWAQPLAPTRLSDLGETSPLAAQATLEGRIEDAQGRFNLRNLVAGDGSLVPDQLATLDRLANAVGAPPGTARLIALHLRSCYAPAASPAASPAGSAAGAGAAAGLPGGGAPGEGVERPLAPVLPGDLALVAGIDPAAARRLDAFVVLLDQSGTPVNFNTAGPEVMSAAIPGLSLGDARALAAERDQAYFRDTADVQNRLHGRAGQASVSGISVNSQTFIVRGTVAIGRASLSMQALVRRGGSGTQGSMDILWKRER